MLLPARCTFKTAAWCGELAEKPTSQWPETGAVKLDCLGLRFLLKFKPDSIWFVYVPTYYATEKFSFGWIDVKLDTCTLHTLRTYVQYRLLTTVKLWTWTQFRLCYPMKNLPAEVYWAFQWFSQLTAWPMWSGLRRFASTNGEKYGRRRGAGCCHGAQWTLRGTSWRVALQLTEAALQLVHEMIGQGAAWTWGMLYPRW